MCVCVHVFMCANCVCVSVCACVLVSVSISVMYTTSVATDVIQSNFSLEELNNIMHFRFVYSNVVLY